MFARCFTRSPVARALSLCFLVALAEVAAFSDLLLQQVERLYGREASGRLVAWGDLMRQIQTRGEDPGGELSVSEKLERVNAFFNGLRFVSDLEHWGKEDYWATPVEFVASGAGDCEDFSLAKYFTLKELGVPLERMRLTYAKAVKLNQAHMVVSYFPTPDAEPLILDNLVGDIRLASQRSDLVPVYSFNGDGLWLSKERSRGLRIGGSDRLSLWRDLRDRMETTLLTPKDWATAADGTQDRPG